MNNRCDFMDMLNILSFIISIMNYDENLTQSDLQNITKNLDEKTTLLLNEIHSHLEEQDKKLNRIMEALYEKDR